MHALRSLERALAETVSGPRLMRYVTDLARWHRHAGTPDERAAADYLAEVLDNFGYATRVLVHDAYISLPGQARLEWNGRAIPVKAHSFSRPSPAGGLEADMLYAGAGRPSDFEGLDVRGKILLLEGVAGPSAAREASRRGAAGQVHISPHEHIHDMCVSPVWGSPTDEDLARLPATVIVSAAAEHGSALRDAVARGPQRLRLHVEMDTGWRQTPIVEASLPGRDPDHWLMFSGHFCSWYAGAMDNGGANATMLEVAQLCAEHRDRWARGMRVLFWSGHSQGRYSSSTWYADARWEDIHAGCVGHINVDSTGGAGNTVVADTTAMAETGAIADDLLKTYAGQEWSGRHMHRAGDQAFWGIGLSCLFANMSEQPSEPGHVNPMAAVFGGGDRRGAGTGWWWHTPHDTVDKVDEAILVRDTRIYLGAVWRFLTSPVLPLGFAAAAREISAVLEDLQRAAGDRFDLSPCLDRAAAVERLAVQLTREVSRGGERPTARTREINRCLVGLQRALVPIRYARAGPFDQDPALALPLLPGLDDARRLAHLDRGSDEARHLTVRLIRARNRVATALSAAIRTLEDCLAGAEEPR
ncbi:MAG: M28 family peptidase [Armatimonadota bacterium]|nr:M28 family peptidase [Armatimonadota bacterium]